MTLKQNGESNRFTSIRMTISRKLQKTPFLKTPRRQQNLVKKFFFQGHKALFLQLEREIQSKIARALFN